MFAANGYVPLGYGHATMRLLTEQFEDYLAASGVPRSLAADADAWSTSPEFFMLVLQRHPCVDKASWILGGLARARTLDPIASSAWLERARRANLICAVCAPVGKSLGYLNSRGSPKLSKLRRRVQRLVKHQQPLIESIFDNSTPVRTRV